MKTIQWFASLVPLPTVITEPGQYVTRANEVVTVSTVSTKHDFGCHGHYSQGISEHWHKSGRILFGMETCNDIVKRHA